VSAPTWRPAGPPPPAPTARRERPERPADHRPPSPLPLEPAGARPPDGSAWPPPEGDPTVCQLREMSGRDLVTRCGRQLRLGEGETQSDHASVWQSDVTCPRCLARA
jgi:hypothetical protein